MNSILSSPDALAAIRQRKQAIKKKLDSSKHQMTGVVSSLTGSPMPKTTSRAQAISRLIINGLVLYRGYRLCSDIFAGIHSFISPKRRRR